MKLLRSWHRSTHSPSSKLQAALLHSLLQVPSPRKYAGHPKAQRRLVLDGNGVPWSTPARPGAAVGVVERHGSQCRWNGCQRYMARACGGYWYRRYVGRYVGCGALPQQGRCTCTWLKGAQQQKKQRYGHPGLCTRCFIGTVTVVALGGRKSDGNCFMTS